jgi:hypothetical protein
VDAASVKVPVPVPVAVPGGVVPGAVLAVDLRRSLLHKFKGAYPSEVLDDAVEPSAALLALVRKQKDAKEFEWLPRKKVLSVGQVAEPKFGGGEGHGRLGLQGLLLTRAVAFAMMECCHLASIKAYNARFLSLFTAPTLDPKCMRAPTLAEAEVADRAAWGVVAKMMDEGASLDEALLEVAQNRTVLDTGLMARIKLPSGPWGAGKEFVGKGAAGKGEGRGKRERDEFSGAVAAAAAKKKPKGSGRGEVRKRGLCFAFNLGKACDEAACKYTHECGTCGGTHEGGRSKCTPELAAKPQ